MAVASRLRLPSARGPGAREELPCEKLWASILRVSALSSHLSLHSLRSRLQPAYEEQMGLALGPPMRYLIPCHRRSGGGIEGVGRAGG